LIELAPVLSASLKPGGWLVLSGILGQQANEVMAAYDPHIAGLSVTADDGWVRLDGRKNPGNG
jgi:ribosomal protein L11 methyltransferase